MCGGLGAGRETCEPPRFPPAGLRVQGLITARVIQMNDWVLRKRGSSATATASRGSGPLICLFIMTSSHTLKHTHTRTQKHTRVTHTRKQPHLCCRDRVRACCLAAVTSATSGDQVIRSDPFLLPDPPWVSQRAPGGGQAVTRHTLSLLVHLGLLPRQR